VKSKHRTWKKGCQPTSLSFRKRTPARETVAGEALRRWDISNMSRIGADSGMRSFETRVSTLLSSITVFIDSIHSASMSPSSMTHLGAAEGDLEKSRIILAIMPS